MKQIDINDMSTMMAGYQRGPVGEYLCSSEGNLFVTILSFMVPFHPFFGAAVLGIAAGCYISDHLE